MPQRNWEQALEKSRAQRDRGVQTTLGNMERDLADLIGQVQTGKETGDDRSLIDDKLQKINAARNQLGMQGFSSGSEFMDYMEEQERGLTAAA